MAASSAAASSGEELALVFKNPRSASSISDSLRRHFKHGKSFAIDPPTLDNSCPVVLRTLASPPVRTADDASLDLAEFFGSLCSRSLGHGVLYSPVVSSTQTILHQHVAPLPDGGLVCVADAQTAGKGRRTNVWDSRLGCLMFSFQYVLDNASRLPFVQYLVSLALVQAVRSLPQCQDADLRLKWPNDVYADGRKMGGVLLESSSYGSQFCITIGVGLNITNAAPSVCLGELLGPSVPCPSRAAVLAAFCNVFESMADRFLTDGWKPFDALYLERWLHSGQVVRSDTNIHAITLVGLTDTGYLKGVDATGAVCELQPDGNRFDFFNGLVSSVIPPSSL